MVCILLVSNCILYWVIVSNNKAHGWAFCQCVISIVYQVILSKHREQGWALLYQVSNRVDCILYAVIVWKSAEQGWARLKRGWFCLSAISEQQVRTWITLSSNLIIIISIIIHHHHYHHHYHWHCLPLSPFILTLFTFVDWLSPATKCQIL